MKFFFKILLMIAIFWWLIHRGQLNFVLIEETFKNPSYFILGFLIIFLQNIIVSYRAASLFHVYSTKITGIKLINIHFIGQLFSMIAPGGVTSDLVKISYIQLIDDSISKARIVVIMILDRLIGLSSLFLIAGITSMFFYQEIISINSSLKSLIILNLTLFSISVLGFSLIFVKEKYQNLFVSVFPGARLKDWVGDFFYLSRNKNKKIFFCSFVYGVSGQLLTIVSFWVVNLPHFESSINFKLLMSIIPLGFLVTALPVTPGGIGVGHAAFALLLGLVGHKNGASLFNVYWLMCLISNLLGFIPFLMFKNKTTSKNSLEK